MPELINNFILAISNGLRANVCYSRGMSYLPLSGRAIPFLAAITPTKHHLLATNQN